MKKIILLLVLLGGGAYGGWHYYATQQADEKKKEEDAAPKTFTVKKGALRAVVEATGSVVPAQEVQIKCKAGGEIIELPVDVSDVVKKGDLLVKLDPVAEERSVKKAEASLAISQARLAQARLNLQIAERTLTTERARAESGLASAQTKMKEAQNRLARVQQLLQQEFASREELDTAQTGVAQAASALEDARARMEDLKIKEVQIEMEHQDIKIAEAQTASEEISAADARQRLADTKLNSPLAGVVAERDVQTGQIIASGITNVGGGTTVMTLVDLSQIFVLVAVDESDIGRVEVGMPVQITVDAYPDAVFPGEVVRIATKGATTSNVVTFEVKVEVKGPRRKLLKPQMTGNVQIITVDKKDALLVPVAAVSRRRRERFVTVRKADGASEDRPVELGAGDGEYVEIVSGLAEGEQVLLPKDGAQSRWQAGAEKKDGGPRGGMMRMMGRGRRR